MDEEPRMPGMDTLESAPALPQQQTENTVQLSKTPQQISPQTPAVSVPQSAKPQQPVSASAVPNQAAERADGQSSGFQQPVYVQPPRAGVIPQQNYAQTPPPHPAYTQQSAAQTPPPHPANTQQNTAQMPPLSAAQSGQPQTVPAPQPPAYNRQYPQPQDSYTRQKELSPGERLDFIRKLPPISATEAEHCRHRQEKFWYYLLIVLNFIAILGVLGAVAINLKDYGEDLIDFAQVILSESESDSDDPRSERKAERERNEEIEDFMEDTPTELQMLFYGMFMLIIGYCSLYYLNAQVRANSVKITLRNFPEIYSLIESYAWRLGMDHVPDAYIVQESGVLNAFSAYLFRKQYIQINSEIFEVAYREHQDIDALAFVIAHEISHIYYGHATLHYNLPIWFSMNFPLVGAIASRSREYSCDRLAQHLTYNDGLEAMFMLMVDRHLYKMVDKQDYLDHAARESGFFLWLYNLFSSHPVMPKRILALARRDGSGDLF